MHMCWRNTNTRKKEGIVKYSLAYLRRLENTYIVGFIMYSMRQDISIPVVTRYSLQIFARYVHLSS